MKTGRRIPIYMIIAVSPLCILIYTLAFYIVSGNQSAFKLQSGATFYSIATSENYVLGLIAILLVGLGVGIALGILFLRIYRNDIAKIIDPLSKSITAPNQYSHSTKDHVDPALFALQVKNLMNDMNSIEQQTIHHREKYINIANNIPLGFVVVDSNGKIQETNRMMRDWFPSMENAQNKPFENIAKEFVVNQPISIKADNEKGGIINENAMLHTSKGLRFFGITSASLVGNDGQINAIVLWFNDLSERLLTEDELEQKNKELLILNEIITRVNLSNSLSHLCRDVIEFIASKMEFDHGGLYLIDDDPSLFSIAFRKGAPLPSLPDKLDLQNTDSPVWKAANCKEPTFENISFNDPLANVIPDYRALVLVPLLYLDRQIGLMYFANDSDRQFSGNDKMILLNVIRGVGNAVAMALARETIEKSEKKYRDLFENANDIIFMIDLKGDVTSANRKALDYMGYTREHIKNGLNLYQLLTQESYQQALRRLRNRINGLDMDKLFVAEVIKSTGEHAIMEYKAQLIHNGRKPIGVQCIARDISSRLEAEENLRKSEEKYRALVESSQDIIFAIDKDHTLIFFHGFSEYDFDPKTIIGRPIGQIADEKIARHLTEKAAEVFRRNRTTRYEENLEWKGRNLWLSVALSPMRGADGQVAAVLGIARDNTVQKLIELELSQKKHFMESLLRSTHDIIISINDDYQIVFANDAIKSGLGYDPNDIIGSPIQILFRDNEVFEQARQGILEKFKRAGYYRGELELKHSNGTMVSMEATLAGIKSSDGGIPGAIASLRDITERKQMQEELHQHAKNQENTIKKLQAMKVVLENRTEELKKISAQLGDENAFIESVLSSIKHWVRVVDEENNVLFMNKSLRDHLGESPINACTDIFGHPELHAECSCRKAVQTGQTISQEISVNGKFYFIVCSPIVGEDGKITKAVELINDITETKLIQQQMIQSSRMAAIGTLATGIAHEFKNHLGGITGNASYAMTILDDKKEMESILTEILNISSNAANVASSLLSFSRQPGGLIMDVDLNILVSSTLEFIGKEHEGHRIEFESELLRPVRGNPAKFQQAFFNILTNAIEAGENSEKILVKGINEGDQVLLSVDDSGCGIPEENLSRIFDPFFSTKGVWGGDKGKGSGLGLTIARNNIEEFGGHIYVESSLGSGAIFTIALPAIAPTTQKSKLEEFLESIPTGRRIAAIGLDDDTAIELASAAKRRSLQIDLFSESSEFLQRNNKLQYGALILNAKALRIMDFARAFEGAHSDNKDIIVAIISDGRVNFELQNYFEEADFVITKPCGSAKVNAQNR